MLEAAVNQLPVVNEHSRGDGKLEVNVVLVEDSVPMTGNYCIPNDDHHHLTDTRIRSISIRWDGVSYEGPHCWSGTTADH